MERNFLFYNDLLHVYLPSPSFGPTFSSAWDVRRPRIAPTASPRVSRRSAPLVPQAFRYRARTPTSSRTRRPAPIADPSTVPRSAPGAGRSPGLGRLRQRTTAGGRTTRQTPDCAAMPGARPVPAQPASRPDPVARVVPAHDARLADPVRPPAQVGHPVAHRSRPEALALPLRRQRLHMPAPSAPWRADRGSRAGAASPPPASERSAACVACRASPAGRPRAGASDRSPAGASDAPVPSLPQHRPKT